MIEQGIYNLIQTGTSNLAPGFATSLPENQLTAAAPMAWTYRSIAFKPTYTLSGQIGLSKLVWQIDSCGYTAAYAQQLSAAIDGVLRGNYSGTLTDPDNTIVNGIFRTSGYMDIFKDENKSYVRSVDYAIYYYQQ